MEVEDSVKFLHPGTEIEVLDTSPGAPPEGAWLSSKIRKRLVWTDKTGKKRMGYEVAAPWTYGGTTDVDIETFGKRWRLRGKDHDV